MQIKKGFNPDNILVFEKGANISDILANLQTMSMFEGERLVILENPQDELSPKLLTINSKLLTIVFWFDHEIDTKSYPGSETFFFPEAKEASIFPFLDALGNRSERAYSELKKRNESSPNDTQYILTMVFYLLRSLVITPKTAKDFVRNKNARMRANFSEGELVNLYKNILEIDSKIKSGLLETAQADFLMVSSFLAE